MSRFPANDIKFEAVRSLNLPFGSYAITQSGVLGIRELREISDIDMVVTGGLWGELTARYGTVVNQGITQVKIGPYIEVMHEGSFGPDPVPGRPTVDEQIAGAEIIEGLSFVSLEHVLFYKQLANRPKDQPDIAAIKAILSR